LLGSCVLGSIPTAYLTRRWLGKKDIPHYGSGTASSSMVYEHVSRSAAVLVGLFDLLKATLAPRRVEKRDHILRKDIQHRIADPVVAFSIFQPERLGLSGSRE